jgi:hypothetical protein
MMATVLALTFANTTAYYFFQARQKTSSDGSPFLSLDESAIPGRYRLTEQGVEKQILTFNPDRTFTTENGDIRRWELSRDALLVIWIRSTMRYTEIAAPGVFVKPGENGMEASRLEKLD